MLQKMVQKPLRFNQIALGLLAALLVLSFSTPSEARRVKDRDKATPLEKKLLGWHDVKIPRRSRLDEIKLRGSLLSLEKADKDSVQQYEELFFGTNPQKAKKRKNHYFGRRKPNYYKVSILPIEVLDNPQRILTMDHMEKGFSFVVDLPKNKLKDLQVGHAVEFNQYYTKKELQSIGAAKMIAWVLTQDVQGYPAGLGAYLKKGFHTLQYKNTLKSLQLFSGKFKNPQEAKQVLTQLAKSSKDQELKQLANFTLEKHFTN